ncbi:MAG: YdcH family protein [Helicobacteraceae bacterium]|jgi:uncharacterized protein YdcH (DUF465 family)|nr:YdcH family protein [Helicobacteraceae bacterium]
MLHEYRDEITHLKQANARFAKIFERHNELDGQISNIDAGRAHMDHLELERLKKEKLRLKDEAYAIILDYKKSQG